VVIERPFIDKHLGTIGVSYIEIVVTVQPPMLGEAAVMERGDQRDVLGRFQ
jgi:hypothetical protein